MIPAGRGTSPGILVGCCLFSVGTTCLYPGVFTQIGRITRLLVNKFFMLRNLLRQQTPLVLFPTVFFPPSRHCQRHAIVTIQRACRLDHSASPAQSAVLVAYEALATRSGVVSRVRPFFATRADQCTFVLVGDRVGCISVHDWQGKDSNAETAVLPMRRFEAHVHGFTVTAIHWD